MSQRRILLTDTGEDSKLVHRRIWPKVDTLFPSLFFSKRPSDEYDSAPSRKYSRPLFGRFRLYRLKKLLRRKADSE